MQSIFNITSVEPIYSQKMIVIQTTFRVDETTVNRKSVQVLTASTGTTTLYKLSVDNDKINITLKDWPDLNDTYIVRITDIKDMLHRELISPVTKNIVFNPGVKIKTLITAPLNNEAITSEQNLINFSIKQINPDGTETVKPMPVTVTDSQLPKDNQTSGSTEAMLEDESDVIYHFEFASDIAFFNVIKDVKIPYTSGAVQLDNGQYYMRARAIKDNLFGDWSEVITFNAISVPDECSNIIEDAKREYLEDFVAPVDFFIDTDGLEFEIVSNSNNGETYPEFYIEFSKEIDGTKLPEKIMAYRRDL